ncbi:IBR domain-containing protein [Stagonosporopsis vannaccii]|nr:IBR domain-containing protein [Stagonosporopsis vannaccii]
MSPTVPVPTRVLRSHSATIQKHLQITLPQTPSTLPAPQRTTKRRKHLDPWYPKRKVNRHPKPRSSPATHFTCRICVSHLPASDFIRWVSAKRRYREAVQVPMDCIPHLARNPARRNVDPVCKTCIGAFMAARLDTHGARRVSVGCVEPWCTTPWPWEMVMNYFPVSRLEEYNLASFEHWRVDAGLFTCLAPGCGFVGLLDKQTPGFPQVQCNACAFRACAQCMMPWHKEQTCAEVSAQAVTARMSDPEKETLVLMQARDGKRCPNCQLVIEKDGGCPCMFCPGCQKNFNWDQAASVVPGTKKALPIESGLGYWETPMAVCEVDELERTTKQRAVDDPLSNNGLVCELRNTYFPSMPLPDEDDADL